MTSKTLSIIVPVFNEKATLAEVVARLNEADFLGWQKEIIIINDASTDGTTEIIKALPSTIKKVFLPRNSGKGSAVKAGLAKATGSHCLIQDADLEYNPKDIPMLLAAIKNENDVVFGSRNLSEKRHGALIPRAGVWFITFLINTLFRTKLTDVWTCYKLFPKTAAAFFTEGRFESEIVFTIALVTHGFHIKEVPIFYTPRDVLGGKKIKNWDGIVAIFSILRLYFTYPQP